MAKSSSAIADLLTIGLIGGVGWFLWNKYQYNTTPEFLTQMTEAVQQLPLVSTEQKQKLSGMWGTVFGTPVHPGSSNTTP